MWKSAFAIVGLLITACSGPAINSDGGDLTRLEVEYISRNLSAATEKKYPLLKHKLVNRYIDSLGQQIVSRNKGMPPLPYEFRVLKSNDVHFFSLPGGIIYITLGAIRAFRLEAELVAGIAHELAHQQLNHPLLVWRKRVNVNREKAFSLTNEGDWNTRFLGERGYLFYGEAYENEADQLMPLIIYNAGFDPRAAISYFQTLKIVENKDPSGTMIMDALHPVLENRTKIVSEALLKIPPQKESKFSSSTFIQIKELLKDAEKKGKSK